MKALTIGSATIDIIAPVASREIERVTMHNATASFLMMEEGRKLEVAQISSYVGGGATNTAVSMARQGLEVACLAKLGKDLDGDAIVARLQEEAVDTSGIIRSGEKATGKSIMFSAHDNNPSIFVCRGANTLLVNEDLDPKIFKGCGLVYITAFSGQSAACFPDAALKGKKAGAFVAANPGIRQLTYRGQECLKAMRHIDLLVINAVEASQLYAALPLQSLDRPHGVDEDRFVEGPALLEDGLPVGKRRVALGDFFTAIHQAGPGLVIVTNGGEGAYISEQGTIRFVPALPVEVKGTVGAGDAYASTFAAQIVMGADIDTAAERAARNAAAVVGEIDTQTGLLSIDALMAGSSDGFDLVPLG